MASGLTAVKIHRCWAASGLNSVKIHRCWAASGVNSVKIHMCWAASRWITTGGMREGRVTSDQCG